MKGNSYLLIGAGVLALWLLTSAKSYTSTSINLDNIDDPASQQRLQSLINALEAAGLTDLQIKFCLAQFLQETGMLTDQANYTAMDTRNNYAGITRNGGFVVYPNINAFIADYLGVLNKGTYPLDATSISDFNTRLKANGYYTDNAVTYGNNLNYYFNLLS